MDRRTNGPEGSGGASPTIVTSWVDGDDLDDESGQEIQASDLRAAAPRRAPHLPAASAGSAGPVAAPMAAPVTTAPANGNVPDRTASGPVAASDTPVSEAAFDTATAPEDLAEDSAQDRARGGGADATAVDGIPAFPSDSIARPSSAPVSPSADDWSPDGFARPAADAPSPALSSSAAPPRTEAPAVSAAAFAWEMPDSPPSPARSFLRTGTTAQDATASRTPLTGVGAGAGKTGPALVSAPKKASKRSGQRQAHLTVARVEPWSVMKFSFVVSLVAFVILFVAVSVLYGALAGLGVFDSLQHLVSSLTSSQTSAGVNAEKWFSASRVLGYTALLGSLNIVLITAMSTIGAVVYNLTSRLVGGVEVTLRETE